MKKIFTIISVFSFIGLMAFLLHARDESFDKTNMKSLVERSLFSKGNTARLKHVITKALKGENIVIGVIGGSITGGTGVERPEDRWANLVYKWWQNTFPKATVKFINAGVGGTGSNFGAHRVRRDLLKYKPDFIVAEFAVNDANTKASAETLEGMVRQILKEPNSPALMLLFTTYNDGRNAQEWHSKIGHHYDLPMISYRDAVMQEIDAGRLKWEALSSDIVHPNKIGNRYCAEFIISFLGTVLSEMHGDASLPEIPNIPSPLTSSIFEYTAIYHNTDISPVENNGWAEYEEGWQADKPGSEMEFKVKGNVASIMFYKLNDKGIIEASIDDNTPVRLNGWFDKQWSYLEFNIIAQDLKPGVHTLKIKLLNDKDKNSKDHKFQIYAILVAGLS